MLTMGLMRKWRIHQLTHLRLIILVINVFNIFVFEFHIWNNKVNLEKRCSELCDFAFVWNVNKAGSLKEHICEWRDKICRRFFQF